MKCKRCAAVRYCSRECQEKDWGSHQKICKHLKKDEALSNLQKAKFECFVCGKIGIFLSRLPCCGAHVHDCCHPGGTCPKCGNFCGYSGKNNESQEKYSPSFRKKFKKKMVAVSTQIVNNGLTKDEGEVVMDMLSCIGFVYQSHYKGKKTAEDEDRFIAKVIEAPRAVDRLIVISRIFKESVKDHVMIPEQFARGMVDLMMFSIEEDLKMFRSSFTVHTLKWYHTHIKLGPSLLATFQNPKLCFPAFLSVCVYENADKDARKNLLLEIDESPIAVKSITSEMKRTGQLHEAVRHFAIHFKMINLLFALREESLI